jgi:predicted transposase/invertase (TIGR01784 family)
VKSNHDSPKLIQLILQKTDYPERERRIYISALLYFIDYLLQIPIDLTEKLRNEIIFSKEEIDMMYLDRENLPPTFGELKKMEREEGKEEGKREMARNLLKEGVDTQIIMRASGLTRKEVERLAAELNN